MSRARKVAHFLLHPELADSPPNDALTQAYRELGFEVDLFAPRTGDPRHRLELGPQSIPVEYGRRWLFANLLRPGWRRYSAFSCTCEEPAAVAGALGAIHRRPVIVLADEIRAGSYRGNSPESWKRLCKRGMRRAALTVVNDASRVSLQRSYAALGADRPIAVYPGAYRTAPPAADRAERRRLWGRPESAPVLGFSGSLSLFHGGDWLVDAIQRLPELHAVVQPLWIDEMTRYLLPRIEGHDRLFVEPDRLSWREAWSQAAALDVGMAIYRNPAPQFQLMGISSNRLCMFLAMGVPVVASRQESFRFLEEYDCGVLVESADEFCDAVRRVISRSDAMKANARRCWTEYLRTEQRYAELRGEVGRVLGASGS